MWNRTWWAIFSIQSILRNHKIVFPFFVYFKVINMAKNKNVSYMKPIGGRSRKIKKPIRKSRQIFHKDVKTKGRQIFRKWMIITL